MLTSSAGRPLRVDAIQPGGGSEVPGVPTNWNPSRRATRLLAAAVPALLLLGACGGDGGTDGGAGTGAGAGSAAGSAPEVVVDLVAFMPETIEVRAGSTVTWRQRDAGAHTVTSGTVQQGGAGVTQQPDGRFDSGQVAPGGTFERTFDQAGTYPYFCTLHPATMRGEVRVR